MAQLMTVKLARFDGSPWGFRLQGGIDFAQPLCIQKVNGGSPAETAGLQAGDAIIKVNNTDVFNLRHKEAQDVIVKAGNSFEISIHRGGASTWKPQITPVGALPKPAPLNNNVAPVTKTSLAVNKPEAAPIGSGHNNLAKPFGAPQLNGNSITSSSITSTSQVDTVKSITSKQYNTPVGLYSEENIAETLSAQAEVLASGVLGVNFKKNERKYEPNNSEVLRMVQEVDQEPRDAADPEGKLAEFEYKENLRNIRNGAFQSGTFKRLQAALDEECHPKDPAFAPNSSLRKVTAPETRPAPQANNTPSNNKTQLPPGQNICSECERLIVGVFVRIKERNLHVDCFKCNTCGASLKNIGYFNIGTKLYCDVHAKMAARKNPPGPNLEPVAVQPGQFPPAGAIPAHVAAAANLQSPVPLANPPAPLNQPNSAVNAPLPFHGPTPPSSAPVQQAPAPKPFFSPPPPTVSSAHMNKPIGGQKFSWPPQKPEDLDPMLTGPTACPIYINPLEPTPLERPPPPPQPTGPVKPVLVAPVKPPKSITPVPIEKGPPVYLQPEFNQRPVSPMVFALTTAPAQPYNLRASPLTVNQNKGTASVRGQQTVLPNFQPSFDAPPQPFQPQQFPIKPIQPVQPPHPVAAPVPKPAPPPPQVVAQPPPPPPQPVVQPPPLPPQPVFSPPAFAPAPPQPQIVAPKPQLPSLQAVAAPQARPISPLPPLATIPVKQTFPPPAPVNMPRPTSPLPQLTSIPAKQTFPPPAPLLNLSKTLSSAVAAAAAQPPVSEPDPSGFGGAPPANNAGNAKGGSLAGTTAPRRGRGVLSAPVAAGGRVPLCGHCSGQIRGPFITAMGKTWCPDHFICVNAQCQRPLQDCGFVEEKGDLYCEFCFEQFLAPACDKCRKKIKGDCLNAIGKHFHPECFNCAYCGKLFGNSPFFLEDGLPYCEGDWNELFTTKCFACGFPIEAGDRWVEALNNNYHSQCFNCTSCKKNLEGQSFFAKQGRPFCKAHAR
ncbi:PDZ and LIM domain protein Zasp isoform X2 [Neocloeon triangulifer]|uniref:PDZ and LIM domain protein Zasp isoform X2 n=1 Tax=Neocloeon triangulifer TaxID=2078957 RepID=UPI00286EE35E|nr:PDZ and LIM domain protein Zasp isoform X2 [Neocloeon triangulifer]